MATYSEIRQEILITLDQDPDATGDIYDLVNLKLKSVFLNIISKTWPRELLTFSNPFRIDSSTESISIATDLEVNDLLKPYTVFVNTDPTNTASEGSCWKYYSPESWVRSYDRLAGNILRNKSYSILGDAILLTPAPTGSEEFDVTLIYYREPAAITDNGIPEFPKQHHSLLVHGVCKEFPHLFAGDRAGLFATIIQNYSDGLKALLDDLDPGLSDMQIVLSPAMQISGKSRQNINWGGRQSS